MKKYIRAKDYLLTGIFEVQEEHFIKEQNKEQVLIEVITKETMTNPVMRFIPKQIEKSADTIEELICDDDILYIYDLYPDAVLVVEGNIKPFGYQEAIKLKEWLDYKPKFDLLIKDSKGNYIKRAKMNDKGELELL